MIKGIVFSIVILVVLFIVFSYLSVSNTEETVARSVVYNAKDVDNIDFKKYDSVLVAASNLYQGNQLKEFMQGKHYRKAWSQPIQVPILWLDTAEGGLQVIEEGGGTQTNSLDLKSQDGTIYTLRSVNKDPRNYVPDFLKMIGLENIVIDGISAQHPYGAVVAAALSEYAGVLHTHPRVVFVPKQDRLDRFNDSYGNKLYLLEYETEGKNNWTNLADVEEIVETDKLVELKMELKDTLQVDKSALIRARLFDFLIGDWDRHSKQWGWALRKTDTSIAAVPIAADRDNAFYNVSGVVHTIVANKNITPMMRPFDKDIDYLEGLVKKMDRYFLLNTNEESFVKEALHLQEVLTDEKVEAALRSWPIEIYRLDGPEIKEKIIARRENLIAYAKEFKRIIDSMGVNDSKMGAVEEMDLPDALVACFECMGRADRD